MSTIKVSSLPDASTPLTGAEEIMIVQSGTSRKTTVADLVTGQIATLGGELAYVAAAGDNNNVAFGNYNRLLVDTAAGDATITSIIAGSDGQLCIVTNRGPNLLTLANEDAGGTAVNRLYGVTALTLPSQGSYLLQYSGTLARWVMV